MKELDPQNVFFMRLAVPEKDAKKTWQALAGWIGAVPEGKSFAFEIPTDMLESEAGREERARLVQANVVAAVISLPVRHRDEEDMERMHRAYGHLVPTSIVVLAQHAPVIRMAALERGKELRERFLNIENDKVFAMASQEGPNVFDVTPGKILENEEVSLSPSSYIAPPSGTCRRMALGTLAAVNRGGLALKSKVEQSDTPTNCRLINIRTILGPVDEMPYLKSIPEDAGRFCVQKGDIVLSRTAPYRLRLLDDLKGQKIFADMNIIFLRVKEATLLPTILYLYLQSEEGQAQLSGRGSGALRALNLRRLEQVQVPVPEMEQQQAIARHYEELAKQLAEAEQHAVDLRKEIDGLMAGL